MRQLLIVVLGLALALTSCRGQANPQTANGSVPQPYDNSKIQKVDEIAALVPKDIANSGKLVVGAALDYAPAEFLAEDLKTPIGYGVDLASALAKVLGLEAEVQNGEFASLLPGIGTKYNIGISSFTITKERTANYNMVAYISVSSAFGVKTGNPDGFDPNAKLCGQTIGVQTGTWQEEELTQLSQKCVADGDTEIKLLSYSSQSDVTTNIIGGKAQAMYADSTVIDYAVHLTNGQMEAVGAARDAANQGVVVSKDDAELTEAIQKATQYLMDQGIWKDILSHWGIDTKAGLTKAELNAVS